ncbi:TPA: hypothetical protein ACF01X_002625 [Yersinia enterocolitica]
MKKRFSDQQLISVLRAAEARISARELYSLTQIRKALPLARSSYQTYNQNPKIALSKKELLLTGLIVNKQQLAAKIWESANQMRSKIEAN